MFQLDNGRVIITTVFVFDEISPKRFTSSESQPMFSCEFLPSVFEFVVPSTHLPSSYLILYIESLFLLSLITLG